MSHFPVLVLVKDNVRDIEKQVGFLLSPYDEGKKVPKYETACSCIGRVASNEVRDAAEREFPSWDALRKAFHEKHPWVQKELKSIEKKFQEGKKLSAAKKKELRKEHDEVDRKGDLLFQEFVAPKRKFIEDMTKKHPMKSKPDPGCGFYDQEMIDGMRKREPENKKYQKLKAGDRYEDKSGCGGTGKVISNYNPKSQWDWWVIGGRWTGALVEDYDPYTDPDNLEECFICRGTGKRDDALGVEARKSNPAYTCNGCSGTGKSVKHTLKRFPGDILPTRLVPKDYLPHALVTPDGEWHQESVMGWFGMTGEKDASWPDKVAKILKQNRENTVAVVVDCHI